MKNKYFLASSIALLGAISVFNVFDAQAAMASEPALEPEVVSSTWEEGEDECAAVTINGEEVIAYRGETNEGSAEDKAEDLADKLEDLLDDEKDCIESLVPGREGNLAAIKLNGKTIVKFEPAIKTDGIEDSEEIASIATKASLNIINSLRAAIGASKLSDSMARFAEASATGRLASLEGDEGFSGRASWYGPKFHGRRTSNGERFDQDGMTAAHRTLPFGTKLLVTNRNTGKSCVVKVNDRGPYKDNRVIDLSMGAAKQLNMISSGVAMVDVLVLQ